MMRNFWFLIALLLSPPPSEYISAAVAASPTSPKAASAANWDTDRGGYLPGRGPKQTRIIIFVNGIFGDANSTWTNANGSYWPKLIADDSAFNDADIFVYSFNSPVLTSAQNIDLLAGQMRDYLQDVVDSHSQVVFLTHSMGGLVTRAYLVKVRPPYSKVPMIYFFATPTAGANVAGIAQHLSANPQLKYMELLNADGYVGDLADAWLATSEDPRLNYPNQIQSYCAFEVFNTYGIKIVERTSAILLCNHEPRGIDANHMDIVKPQNSTNADPYVAFRRAYLHEVGPFAGAIRRTVASIQPVNATHPSTEKVVPDLDNAEGRVVVRQIRANREYVEVGCEERKVAMVVAEVKLEDGEHVTQVIPAIENRDNIKSFSAAVLNVSGARAEIRYTLQGLDRVLFNCPGGGHADVVANFIVTRPPLK